MPHFYKWSRTPVSESRTPISATLTGVSSQNITTNYSEVTNMGGGSLRSVKSHSRQWSRTPSVKSHSRQWSRTPVSEVALLSVKSHSGQWSRTPVSEVALPSVKSHRRLLPKYYNQLLGSNKCGGGSLRSVKSHSRQWSRTPVSEVAFRSMSRTPRQRNPHKRLFQIYAKQLLGSNE